MKKTTKKAPKKTKAEPQHEDEAPSLERAMADDEVPTADEAKVDEVLAEAHGEKPPLDESDIKRAELTGEPKRKKFEHPGTNNQSRKIEE